MIWLIVMALFVLAVLSAVGLWQYVRDASSDIANAVHNALGEVWRWLK